MAFSSSDALLRRTIARNVFGGRRRIAVSMWLQWTNRADAYGSLFGNNFEYGKSTRCFDIRWYGKDKLSLNVGIENGGKLQVLSDMPILGPNHGISPDVWSHLFWLIDPSVNGTVQTFVNRVAQVTANLQVKGKTIHVAKEDYPLELRAGNGQWKFGEISVWVDDQIPTVDLAFAGTASGRSIHLANISPQTITIAPSGAMQKFLPEKQSGLDLTAISGKGVLNAEIGEPTANLKLANEFITHSGIVYRTDWKRGRGETDFDIELGDGRPSFSKNGGPYVVADKAVRHNNTVFWVLPPAVRPTQALDKLLRRFPTGMVRLTVADFNASEDGVPCTNLMGQEPYGLPPLPRAFLNSSVPSFSEGLNRYTRLNLYEYHFTPWIRPGQFDNRGIPTTTFPQTGEESRTGLTSGWRPDFAGNVVLLWRGSPRSECYLTLGQPREEYQRVGPRTTVTGPDGQLWFQQEYICPGGLILACKPVATSPFPTELYDIAVVMKEHYPRWLAGQKWSPAILQRHRAFASIRWMDAMRANSGNATEPADILPDDYVPIRDIGTVEYPATIVSTAAYAYPVAERAYFAGTCFLANCSAPHQFRTGQTLDVSKVVLNWWRRRGACTRAGRVGTYGGSLARDGFTTGTATRIRAGVSVRYVRVITDKTFSLHATEAAAINGNAPLDDWANGFLHLLTEARNTTWHVDAEAPGLQRTQVVIGTNQPGFIENASSNGSISAPRQRLPAPLHLAQFHNELASIYNHLTACWLTRPPVLTPEAWNIYVRRLDAVLDPRVELWVEWSNETWNTAGAFQGQFRIITGMSARLGITPDEYYTQITYDSWRIARDVCRNSNRGRIVKLVNAGHSVNPSVLRSRMHSLQKYWQAVNDPNKPAKWDALPVLMTVSNYYDFVNFDLPGNRDGLIAAGPLGTIDMGDIAYRNLSAYREIKALFKKPLVAYEGGAAWDTPSDDPPLTRTVFAALHAPRAKNIQWGCMAKYAQEAGFDMLCTLSNETNWSEITGKNWGNYKSWSQLPGTGDGKDGRFNNVADFARYIALGEDASDYHRYVSVRGFAQNAWAGVPSDPQARVGPLPTTVVLDASTGPSPPSAQESYRWTKVAGPDGGTLSAPDAPLTEASELIAGMYVFRCEISDRQGPTSQQEFVVQVFSDGSSAIFYI